MSALLERRPGASHAVLTLVMDVIDRVPGLGYRAAHVRQLMRDKLGQHREYITRHGEDLPEVRDWVWQSRCAG